MNKFRYHMDFGSGWVLIDIFDNTLKYKLVRTISEFTYTKVIGGTFKMLVSDFTDLPNLIETDEVMPFRMQEDIDLGGTPDWTDRFEGTAHLRGDVDWTKGVVEIFGFTDTTSKLAKFLSIWDVDQIFTRTIPDYTVIITNGTTPYEYSNNLAYFFDGMEELFTWLNMSELTIDKTTLPFVDPDYLMIFSSLRYKGSVYTGAAHSGMITIQRMLYWLEKMFQIYWYIDESTPASPILKFYQPDDSYVSLPEIDVVSDVNNIIRDSYKDSDMVWLENFNFANELDGSDFIGFPIRYPNQTLRKINYDLTDVTTNVWGAADSANDGAIPTTDGYSLCWCTQTDIAEFTTITGTGLISSATISNEYLSKANLHIDYFQTNRYHIRSGVYINDSLETLADDAVEKHLRDYPDYQAYLTELPTTMGVLKWEYNDPDYKLGLIMEISTDLATSITTYKSRQYQSWLS